MIYESSPSIEASQGSNYSTKSENAKDLNLDKCQKVFEALGLSPLKKEKVEDSAYVSKKIASATGEMYKNMNMQPPAVEDDEDKNYAEIITNIKHFIEGKKFDECTEVLVQIPTNWTIQKIMHEFNLSERRAKAVKKLQSEGLSRRQRKKRSDSCPEDVMELAEIFYELPHISRQIGDMKNIMRIKLGNDQFRFKARVVLYNNIKETYSLFMQDHGQELKDRGVSFGESMFLKAK